MGAPRSDFPAGLPVQAQEPPDNRMERPGSVAIIVLEGGTNGV